MSVSESNHTGVSSAPVALSRRLLIAASERSGVCLEAPRNMSLDPNTDPTAQWLLGRRKPKLRRNERRKPEEQRPPSRYARVFLDRMDWLPPDEAERYVMAWISVDFWDESDVGRWLDAGCDPKWSAAASKLAKLGVPPALACQRALRAGRTDDRWVELVHRGKVTAEFVRDLARRQGLIA